MIRRGTSLSFAVNGDVQAWFYNTPSDVRGAVRGNLLPYFTIQVLQVDPRGTVLSGTLDWEYDAVLTVKPLGDYNSLEDVKSVVAHAFAQATGNVPVVGATGADPDPSGDRPADSVPWSNTLVFVAVAIALVAVLGLKKL